jgi:hypothetical protein
MPDNVASRSATEAMAELKAQGIKIIAWPPFSPD